MLNLFDVLRYRMISKDKVDSMKYCFPQFRIDNAPSVVLETIKKAEDSDDIIIRMFEGYGGHARARLIRYMIQYLYEHTHRLMIPLQFQIDYKGY